MIQNSENVREEDHKEKQRHSIPQARFDSFSFFVSYRWVLYLVWHGMVYIIECMHAHENKFDKTFIVDVVDEKKLGMHCSGAWKRWITHKKSNNKTNKTKMATMIRFDLIQNNDNVRKEDH